MGVRHSMLLGIAASILSQMARPTFPMIAFASERSEGQARNYLKGRSIYMPHQGKRERARRVRQMAKAKAKSGG